MCVVNRLQKYFIKFESLWYKVSSCFLEYLCLLGFLIGVFIINIIRVNLFQWPKEGKNDLELTPVTLDGEL